VELIDSYGRTINYLRLSVTDRCNLRCQYCMPAGGIAKVRHNDILSFEELLLIAECAVGLGIEKIRITGGEPLIRRGIVPFLARLAAIPGLRHLALTTNGLLLPELAVDLYQAGVQRLNVSLDSLDPATFAAITRGGELSRVLTGIAVAGQAGFPPVKINMVVMGGINDHELLDFARLTLDKPCAVRFIEYMPSLKEPGWQERAVPGQQVLDLIARHHDLEPVDKGAYAGPSRDFRIRGAAGTIGIITPVSGHFCGSCNRLRVTARGTAKSCLFSGQELDLCALVKAGDRDRLAAALGALVATKPAGHGISRERAEHDPFAMSRIGG
jgi:cyclic pyranopterin phosphate synthase